MRAEHRLVFGACTPSALFSHWAWTLRAAMTVEKDEIGSAEVEHVDPRRSEKGAVNALLIFSCIIFGAASFIFGYDDKLVSPLAALTPFVSAFMLDCFCAMRRTDGAPRLRNFKAPIRRLGNMLLRPIIKTWSSRSL